MKVKEWKNERKCELRLHFIITGKYEAEMIVNHVMGFLESEGAEDPAYYCRGTVGILSPMRYSYVVHAVCTMKTAMKTCAVAETAVTALSKEGTVYENMDASYDWDDPSQS